MRDERSSIATLRGRSGRLYGGGLASAGMPPSRLDTVRARRRRPSDDGQLPGTGRAHRWRSTRATSSQPSMGCAARSRSSSVSETTRAGRRCRTSRLGRPPRGRAAGPGGARGQPRGRGAIGGVRSRRRGPSWTSCSARSAAGIDGDAGARQPDPPSLLDAGGLAPELRAAASREGVPVRIDVDVRVTVPPEITGAVYFCVLDSLERAPTGTSAVVSVRGEEGALAFEVVAECDLGAERRAPYAIASRRWAARHDRVGGRPDHRHRLLPLRDDASRSLRGTGSRP